MTRLNNPVMSLKVPKIHEKNKKPFIFLLISWHLNDILNVL